MKTLQVTFFESPRFRGKGYQSLLEMGYPVCEVGFFNAQHLKGSPVETLVRTKRNANTEGFSLPEVCCYLGHLAAWNEFLESDEEHCLIVEDDATPLVTCEELTRLVDGVEGFDALQLIRREATWREVNHPDWLKGSPCGYGLIAYVLSRRGAMALIDQQNLKAADLKLMQLSMTGVVFGARKNLFKHDWSIPSTIQGVTV